MHNPYELHYSLSKIYHEEMVKEAEERRLAEQARTYRKRHFGPSRPGRLWAAIRSNLGGNRTTGEPAQGTVDAMRGSREGTTDDQLRWH